MMQMVSVIDVMVHISILLCIGMIIVVAQKSKQSPVRIAFLFVLGIMCLWSIGTLLELDFRIATGVTYMPFIYICYIGICLMPVALLCLGRIILQPDWRPKIIHGVFLIIPLISIFIVFTDSIHHLFFINFSLDSSQAQYGPYYYFHSIYSYGCIVAGIVLMLVASARNSGLFSKQSLLVISAVVVTAVPNILFSFGIVANLPFSVSAAAFTVSILCFLIAFFKYHFITTLPITLRQVVDLISDGYLVIDRHLCILSYNRALLQLFPNMINIEAGTNLRPYIDQYFSVDAYQRFLKMQAQAIARHETVSSEEQLLTQNAYINVEITPVIERNIHIGSIVLLKDITQSKLLIEASKAESRYKSEFLSNMSHEIRTPMNAIIGMINIGKSTDNKDQKDYCLMKIDDASKHLLGVINNILDISKIEAGKFELSLEEFDFEKMIGRVVDIFKFRADEKKQTLSVDFDHSIPRTLLGDDLRLSQVITNLIGNAIKFTPEQGSVFLKTHLLSNKDNVCTIQIEVTDTGIGISPEQQSRLFRSFSQAESDTSRKFGGTGLGLTISKNIVEKMGGKIWIESEIGKGATFAFTVLLALGANDTLPKDRTIASNDNPERVKSQANAESEQTVDLAAFAGHCILLAEDVEINREIVQTLLEPTRLVIDCAKNGKEAVRMFCEAPEKYEMIFMDVQMPEMDGYEATMRIRAFEAERAKGKQCTSFTESETASDASRLSERPKGTVQCASFTESETASAASSFAEGKTRTRLSELERVPIIAMTANVFREDIEKCLAAGMNGHVGKPFDIDQLIKKLHEYLLTNNRQ